VTFLFVGDKPATSPSDFPSYPSLLGEVSSLSPLLPSDPVSNTIGLIEHKLITLCLHCWGSPFSFLLQESHPLLQAPILSRITPLRACSRIAGFPVSLCAVSPPKFFCLFPDATGVGPLLHLLLRVIPRFSTVLRVCQLDYGRSLNRIPI